MAQVLAAVLVLVARNGAGSAAASTYFVRQTIGDDMHDGRAAGSAWRTLAKLSTVLRAGDTVYVGPGLYREQVTVSADGTSAARIVLVADTTGEHTGDPPGTVMITGADPVDPAVFTPVGPPGVYRATLPQHVLGAVEMDGLQRRYRRARDTMEHLVDKLSEDEVVTRVRGSHVYDEERRELLLHTSDDRPPSAHEIELMHRGTGIGVFDKHFVTVAGFTLRHFGDAGITFFKGAGDGIAINNIAYGGRQGIRVYTATNMLIYGNTLFRNDNSGVYFAAQSTGGVTIANTVYENVKGIRWSSQSNYGMALDNVAFDNSEAGIAIEDVEGTVLRRNRLLQNPKAQLTVIRSVYDAEDECFEGPSQAVAEFFYQMRYATVPDYQRAKGVDLHARADGCGAPPAKIDVHKLHHDTMEYVERARALLASGASPEGQAAGTAAGGWSWWRALLGR